jgi:hypothetical protein
VITSDIYPKIDKKDGFAYFCISEFGDRDQKHKIKTFTSNCHMSNLLD